MKVLTSVVIVAGVLALLAVGARAGEGAREVLLFDFESPGNFENADKLQYVAEHVTQGEKAGKVTLDQPFSPNFFFFGGSNAAGRWGEFDQFVIDVFVEGGPVTCAGFVVADGKQDWWERYNYEFKLPPGARRLAFSLGAFVRQRDQRPLDISKLTFFAIQFAFDAEGAPATIWLDNARLVKGTGTFEVKRLFSFEGADAGSYALEDWPPDSPEKSDLALVSQHASEGGKALRLSSRSPAGNVTFSGFESDWSGYDALAMDVFSAGDAPVKVFGWIKPDSPTADYWQRHNWERVLRPGPNSVRLSLGGLTNPRNEPVDLSNVVAFNVAVDNTVIFIDNVRLVKGVEEVKVEGLRTFDFGPSTSAVMPGFTRVSKETVYGPGRGYGWLPGGAFGRDFDIMEMLGRHRPPDDLCRDFSMPTRASFAVALPDGEYRVWLMLGPPGNGWGPWFQHRTVSVAGKAVVDEAYAAESFRRYEFQFEDAEDLPGDDLWSKYIDPLFRASEFDVAVKDGRLVLDFDGHGATWCCMVNGLVVYPKAQAAAGARWLAGLADRRKEQYDSLHVEELPPAPAPYQDITAVERTRGYVRFVHSPDRDVQVNSVPTAEEVAASLELAAAPGEYEDACLGLLPLEDCGRVRLEVSDLAGPGGAAIPAANVQALVVRYKALNRGAVYVITPKYLDSVPAEGVATPAGVTRSFWIVITVPTDAMPGTYTGRATLVSEQGGRDTVPLTLTVWPVKLVEPEFPMGMFMMGPSVSYFRVSSDTEAYWREWRDILADAREHGLTSVDPLVDIPLMGADGGKAQVDFSRMDRFMELAKAAGFHLELNGYGVGTGFRYRNCTQSDEEARGKGFSSFAAMVRAYFAAVREHAAAKEWLPICFCTDDEYIVHPGGVPAKLAELHRILQTNAPGFHFVAFDSVRNQTTEEAQMLADIDTFGAGIHTPWVAETIAKAGRRLWLYNTGMNRFTFGTYMFFARKRYGVEGFFQWVYPSTGTYTPHYLASHNEAHYGVVYPSTRGLRTTVTWERIRAGCDDHRYLESASQLIKQAKASGKGLAEAKALENSIEETLALLSFGKPNADAFAGVGRAENPMAPAAMEAFRSRLAEGLIRLQNALQ